MFDRVDEETFIVYQVDNMSQYMLQYIFEPHRDKIFQRTSSWKIKMDFSQQRLKRLIHMASDHKGHAITEFLEMKGMKMK